MAVRVRYKLEVAVSSTSAEEKDLADLKYEVVTDDLGEGGAWKTTVADGAADVEIQLPNLADSKFLVLRTNPKDTNNDGAELTIKRNGAGGEAILITPIGDLTKNKEGHLLLSTTGLTSLFATNAAGFDLELTVVAAGD